MELVGPEGSRSIKSILPGAGGLKFYSWFFILTDLAMQEISGTQVNGTNCLDTARILEIIKHHASSGNAPGSFLYRFPGGTEPLVIAETN